VASNGKQKVFVLRGIVSIALIDPLLVGLFVNLIWVSGSFLFSTLFQKLKRFLKKIKQNNVKIMKKVSKQNKKLTSEMCVIATVFGK